MKSNQLKWLSFKKTHWAKYHNFIQASRCKYCRHISQAPKGTITHCGLVKPYGIIELGQHWLSNGLLPDGTKPSPAPMLTSSVRSLAFTWELFNRNSSRFIITHHLRFQPLLPEVNELTYLCQMRQSGCWINPGMSVCTDATSPGLHGSDWTTMWGRITPSSNRGSQFP